MPLGKLKPMTPRSAAGMAPPAERVLMAKYGFDGSQAKRVSQAFGNDAHKIQSFASMSLHIKGMGFLRDEIVEVIDVFGDNALDLANWQGMKGMSKHLGSMELVYLAYTAGLTPADVGKMAPKDLTKDKLSVMANLRSL